MDSDTLLQLYVGMQRTERRATVKKIMELVSAHLADPDCDLETLEAQLERVVGPTLEQVALRETRTAVSAYMMALISQ